MFYSYRPISFLLTSIILMILPSHDIKAIITRWSIHMAHKLRITDVLCKAFSVHASNIAKILPGF